MSKRRNDIDAVKGIAMLCIVVGHSGIDWVANFLFTFHVPIFLIISGLFFTPREGLIQKRIVQLMRPYLTTAVLLYIVKCAKLIAKIGLHRADPCDLVLQTKESLLEIVYASGSRTDFFSLELPAIGAIWFFPAIVWASAFLYLILKYIPQKAEVLQPLLVIMLFFVAWVSAKITWLPLSVQAGMSCLLFVYIGYLAKKYKVLEQKAGVPKIVTAVLLWGIGIYCSYANERMSVVRSAFPDVIFNVAGAVGASYLILCIVKHLDQVQWISKSAVYHWICYWGRYSGTILCCHLLELRLVNWHILADHGKVFLILVFLLKMVIITGLTWLINRNEKIKKFF